MGTSSGSQRTLAGAIAADVRHRLLLPRWQLAACSSMHAVNDALLAGLYPLLPLMAVDLGLSYGAIVTIALSELLTAASLGGLLVAPLWLAPVVLLPLGFVLNGTSSVLYASEAGLVAPERRSRGYRLYDTGTQVASALFPILYGLLADGVGLTVAFAALAVVTAAIAPRSLTMRTHQAA